MIVSAISYATVSCRLGCLLVGATGTGVCFVSLGDSEEELVQALRERYPSAGLQRAVKQMPWLKAVAGYVDGRTGALDVPVDVSGTRFQQRVWQELQRIPRGETRSYSQLARAIGKPSAVRAVAHACAVNPVAIVVPCHRIIREDGGLGGYRWGLERKRALLEQECGKR